MNSNYVLITAAHNEEKYIESTIKSVILQTVLPQRWIIISDGSTDSTDEIVVKYSGYFPFIHLIRKKNTNKQVDFSSKVQAIKTGYATIQDIDFEFVGILDADVTFDSSYYEHILNESSNNPKLGIAGGIVLDQYGNQSVRRSPDNLNYVSGCIQLFRRRCYEEVGGLSPLKDGGEDTVAAVTAQMKGWEVKAFEEFPVYHHKHSATTRDRLKDALRTGKMFYALGSHPLFEILKSIKILMAKPFLLFSVIRTYGYFISYFTRRERPVNKNFIGFLRRQQLAKLKNYFTP